MKKALLPLVLGLVCTLPAAAGDFSLYGSYWDTDAAGETAGGGLSVAGSFTDVVGWELRASYFEVLSDDPISNIFDSDEDVFKDQGLNVLPLEVGLRFTIPAGDVARPYFSVGGGYYLLDSDFGEVKDEVGYYATLGSSFGNPNGASFFIEGTYRKLTGTVEVDPEDLGDIDDIDINGKTNFDLDGFGVNVGVRWSF